MRITRTLATTGLPLATLGIAGGATIASAAPHTHSGVTAASTQSQSSDKPGKPEIRSVALREDAEHGGADQPDRQRPAEPGHLDPPGRDAQVRIQYAGAEEWYTLTGSPTPPPPDGLAAFHERVVEAVKAGGAAEVPDTIS
ncbi:hypothetical protein [Streptomyces sp. G1]|uniref:hypothetical protein n=1 Tax=Streptomyces sp. G1 TaxID=361572 RepID=UPI00202FAAEB|nr:hypothetical protein [Streptomyces sp. G1]MCM1976511.1 hypothetical protein [Streptomyces sp. G1]